MQVRMCPSTTSPLSAHAEGRFRVRCLLQLTSRPQAPMAWRTAGSGSHSPTLTAVGWSPSPTIRGYATHTHTHTTEQACTPQAPTIPPLTLIRTGSWPRARRAERSSRTSTCLTTGVSSMNAKTNRCVREGRLIEWKALWWQWCSATYVGPHQQVGVYNLEHRFTSTK